ncbi:MAG: universal stress protein [Rhodospirillales bacterium]
MKRLLMATDLSARSDRALERALALAKELEASLTLVHVVEEGLPARLADAQAEAARQALRDQVARLTEGEGPAVSIEVLFGRAYMDIVALSEKLESDLFVLGVHRRDALLDMFRGTTAERVIRAGNVPVLLAKEPVVGPYRRILVGVDFSVYSRRAVEFAVKFVPHGEFHLVHAYDVPFKSLLARPGGRREISKQHQMEFDRMVDGEMARFLASLEASTPKLERVLQEGMVREVIYRQIERLKPDLLVIGTHGRTGVAHAFLGSVAEDLLRDPPCDVLAVKAW